MAKTSRKVKRRSTRVNLTTGQDRTSRKPSKKQVSEAIRRVNKTRTRRFLLYALACFALMQLIRFFSSEYIFSGPSTPGGFLFLVIIYVQFGLMFGFIGLCAAASVSYLRSLKD